MLQSKQEKRGQRLDCANYNLRFPGMESKPKSYAKFWQVTK